VGRGPKNHPRHGHGRGPDRGRVRDTGTVLSIKCESLRQDLERHLAIRCRVARAIDDTHPTFAERRQNFISADPATNRNRHVRSDRRLKITKIEDSRSLTSFETRRSGAAWTCRLAYVPATVTVTATLTWRQDYMGARCAAVPSLSTGNASVRYSLQ